jgi:Xaa-Pro aminopeptidase
MSARIERLRSRFEALGVRSFLVSNAVDVRYLTGFESSNAYALVGDEAVRLITDGRYIEAARAVPGVEAVQSQRGLAAWLGAHLAELAEPPVGFQAETVTVAQHEELVASGVELVPTHGVVLGLRRAKDADELDAIGRAARVTDDVLARLAKESLAGRTEADVAWWILQAFHEEGADGPAFDPIVASGPNAALPHHHPGPRVIGRGETVIVDLGAKVDGYCSDCTRTFATGPLPEELRRAYAVCLAAQEAGLDAVRAGAGGRDVDAVARTEIEEAAIADVLHGLGHGVGLEVHEAPVLRPESEDVLAAGNVVTVEPGVYLPGLGGVRIEDLVVVTENGGNVLSPFTKDLLTLD